MRGVGDEPGGLGRELARELLDVTLEEFRLTESRFETDSRLGRELLYLLSNTEWVRRTTEILDISRVSAVETRVVVDVDVSYIAHEALRTVDGPIWLPLIALPREVDADGDPLDGPISVDVVDGDGSRVAGVPQAELRRQLAAALAETLVTRLQPAHRGALGGRVRPAAGDPRPPGAARGGAVPAADPPARPPPGSVPAAADRHRRVDRRRPPRQPAEARPGPAAGAVRGRGGGRGPGGGAAPAAGRATSPTSTTTPARR